MEILEAPVETEQIRKIYDFYSNFYFLLASFEKRARMKAIKLANIRNDDKVLEVAVGIGHSFVEMLKMLDTKNILYGVDLSSAMLKKTEDAARKNGFTNFNLSQADARKLPFPSNTFDVVYNTFMLDLIPTQEFQPVLKEFYRVLKKDGRLILVNLSKENLSSRIIEKIYPLSPSLLGGCRPVLMEEPVKNAQFRHVNREFINDLWPSEIVTAVK